MTFDLRIKPEGFRKENRGTRNETEIVRTNKAPSTPTPAYLSWGRYTVKKTYLYTAVHSTVSFRAFKSRNQIPMRQPWCPAANTATFHIMSSQAESLCPCCAEAQAGQSSISDMIIDRVSTLRRGGASGRQSRLTKAMCGQSFPIPRG